MKIITKIQKKIVFALLFSGIAVLLVSLLYSTNRYDLKNEDEFADMFGVDPFVESLKDDVVKDVSQKINSVNNLLVLLALAVFVLFIGLLIMGNHNRKKFYISNLVAGIAFPAAAFGFALVAFVSNLDARSSLTGNKELLTEFLNLPTVEGSLKSLNVYPFDLTTIALCILMVVSISLIAYTLIKYFASKSSKLEKVGA